MSDKEKESSNNPEEQSNFPTISMPDSSAVIGGEIGPYRLLSVLGEGGFGIVYLAEQKRPVKRTVALKVIKPGMDTKQVIARFEAERQALALLEHPNIARVYNAGSTETGRPYFVMEYIKGNPITEYCDHNKLSIKERLQLFIQVCEAVQHAHQKGIIHRDIKPSNIVVTSQDGKAVPKVIDFGVAKAISMPLTEKTMFTQQGQLIGTPEYMSPEQADLKEKDIDTRTDIYSLGVVLYELLAGALPFEPETLREGGYAEIQRIIREQEPPRPSTKLSSLGDHATEIALSRQAELSTLVKNLHKELEWIPLMAIRKDRDRRYRSAHNISEDIQNYLDGNPLTAGPESKRYKLKKFITRNKALVVSGLAISIILIVGIVVTSTLAIALANSKTEIQQVSEATTAFFENDLLGSFLSDDGYEHKRCTYFQNSETRAAIVSMLNAASRHLSHRFENSPLVEAKIRRVLGLWYRDFGIFQTSEDHLKRSMELCSEYYGPKDRETLGAMSNLAILYNSQEDFSQAEELLTYALNIGRKTLKKDDPWFLNFMGNLAITYSGLDQDAKAEQLYIEILENIQNALGPEQRETLGRTNDFALYYMDRNKYDKAEILLVKTLAIGRDKLEDNDPWLTNFISNLARVYDYQDRYDEAEKLYLEALDRKQAFQGKGKRNTLEFMHNLAHFYEDNGRYEDATDMLTRAIEIAGKEWGQDDEDTKRYIHCLSHLDEKDMDTPTDNRQPQGKSDLNKILIGKPFPELEFEDLEGSSVNINKLKGKVVLIDFWATWCGPCIAETPNLLSVYNDFKDKGFEIIGISLDKDRQKLDTYLEKHEIQWPNYYDGKGWGNEISTRFGVHGIPKMILLDQEGIVKESGLRGDKIRETVARLFGEDIKKHALSPINPIDWKEEYIVELDAIGDITSSQFGVNWFRPHAPTDISTEKPDFIKSLPTFKYDMQRYLTFRLGNAEDNHIYAVADFHQPEQKYFSFDLYLDRDRDGVLADDFIEDSRRITDIQVPYSDNTTEKYSLYVYSYSSNDNSFGFAYQCKAGRYGVIDVGQTEAQLLIIDNNGNGVFNDSQDVILMDWDLDGKIDGSHQANEEVPLYSLLELPGATYQVAEFDPAGRHMVLKLIDLKDQVPKEDSQKLIEHQVVKDGRLKIIKTDPALPASLNLGKKLKIQFEYDLGSAEKVQIWARPYTNGRRTQGYKAHGSPVYSREEKKAGEAEAYFFFDRPTVVDEVRIEMKDATSNTVIYFLSEKIDAKWVMEK